MPEQDPTASSSPASIWRAFVHGATRPSLPSLAIALGLCLAILLLTFTFVTPGFLSGPGYRYFMVNEYDVQMYATHRALGITPSADPIVAVMGTSVVVHCIDGEEGLATAIESRLGQRPVVYNLSANAQTTWEMAALAERLPSVTHGTLVLGLSTGIFHWTIDDPHFSSHARDLKQPKLGVASPALDDEARRAGLSVPRRSGIYSLDNSYFYLGRRFVFLRNLLTGGNEFGDPLTAPWVIQMEDDAALQSQREALKKHETYFDEFHAYNFSVIDRFIAHLQERADYQIIIVEPPVNPAWLDEPDGQELTQKYHNAIEGYAVERGYTFVPITDLTKLTTSDFIDFEGHIGNDRSRKLCNNIIADAVAKELTK